MITQLVCFSALEIQHAQCLMHAANNASRVSDRPIRPLPYSVLYVGVVKVVFPRDSRRDRSYFGTVQEDVDEGIAQSGHH